jgi:hypothetical protein
LARASQREPAAIPKRGQCPSGFVQSGGVLPRRATAALTPSWEPRAPLRLKGTSVGARTLSALPPSGDFRSPAHLGGAPSLLVVGFSGTTPGEDVMVRQVEELLVLTCLGGFVAGITYAVTLLH